MSREPREFFVNVDLVRVERDVLADAVVFGLASASLRRVVSFSSNAAITLRHARGDFGGVLLRWDYERIDAILFELFNHLVHGCGARSAS